MKTAYIELKVYVKRAYNNLGFTLTGDGDASEVTSNMMFNPGPAVENITAWRVGGSGVGGTTYCGFTAGYVKNYVGSGTQTVTLEELPDPTIQGTKTLATSGEAVQFVGSNIPTGFNSRWFWAAGDTGNVTNPDVGGTEIFSCGQKKACTVNPTASGRMYLRFHTGTGATVGYPGPVVWVGRTPSAALTLTCNPTSVSPGEPTSCTAGTNPSQQSIDVKQWFIVTTGDTTMKSVCGTGTTCNVAVTAPTKVYVRALVGGYEQTKDVAISVVPNVNDSLTVKVSCNNTAPIRGNDISCSASATDPAVVVTSWKFTPDDGTAATVRTASGSGPWYGPMVLSGFVTAYGTKDGQQRSGTIHISVQNRAWDTPVRYYGEQVEGQWGTMPYLFITTAGDTAYMGPFGWNIGIETDSLRYGPLTFTGSNTLDTVRAGPNKDYLFVKSSTYYFDRGIVLNRHLKQLGPEVIYMPQHLAPDTFMSIWDAGNAFGINPNDLLNGVINHEAYGNVSLRQVGHQRGLEQGAQGDVCGNISARLERIAGDEGEVLYRRNLALGRAGEYLTVASGHHRVYGIFSNVSTIARFAGDPAAVLFGSAGDPQTPNAATITHRDACDYGRLGV